MWVRYKLYPTIIPTSRHPTFQAWQSHLREARAQVEQQLQGQAAQDLREQLLGWCVVPGGTGYRWHLLTLVNVTCWWVSGWLHCFIKRMSCWKDQRLILGITTYKMMSYYLIIHGFVQFR